jgi:hypothetical protein
MLPTLPSGMSYFDTHLIHVLCFTMVTLSGAHCLGLLLIMPLAVNVGVAQG